MTAPPDLTRAALSAWNRGDRKAWLETFAPDAVYYTSGEFPGLRPRYRGREDLAAFWDQMHEPWETLRVDLLRLEHGADWVVTEFRFRATGTESGASVDMVFCNAGEVRDGLCVKLLARRTFDEALAALEEEGIRTP